MILIVLLIIYSKIFESNFTCLSINLIQINFLFFHHSIKNYKKGKFSQKTNFNYNLVWCTDYFKLSMFYEHSLNNFTKLLSN